MCVISFCLKKYSNINDVEFINSIKSKIEIPFKYRKQWTVDTNKIVSCCFEIIINQYDKDKEDSLKEFIKIRYLQYGVSFIENNNTSIMINNNDYCYLNC